MFKRYVFMEGPTNLLGSNNTFFIYNSGIITDKKGNEITPYLDSNGNKVYSGYRFRLGITDEPWPNTAI